MKKIVTITDAYACWTQGTLPKLNKRQRGLLVAWRAFLGEHETGDFEIVTVVSPAFDTLWEQACKEAPVLVGGY